MKKEARIKLEKWVLRACRAVFFFTAVMWINVVVLAVDRMVVWLPLCVAIGWAWGYGDDWFQTHLLKNVNKEYEQNFEQFCATKLIETQQAMNDITFQVRN